jgi:nicotinamide-nucleotide adenylyltransferase
MKRALYVGRFQLFHKGHLDVIQHIDKAKDITEIIIAVGSSQYNHTNKSPVAPWAVNPFTYEERERMINYSLEGKIEKPYLIIPIPDFHDWPKWKKYVCDTVPKFDVLYTVSEREKKEFEEIGYEARGFPRKHEYHAGIVRERICKGAEWKDALADGTIKVVEEIGGIERIKNLFAMDFAEKLRGGK